MKKGAADYGAYPWRERQEGGGSDEAMNAVPEENRLTWRKQALGEGRWGQHTMLVWRDADQGVDLATPGLEAQSLTLNGHAGTYPHDERTSERTHARTRSESLPTAWGPTTV